jgi:hypothetical protein
MPAFEDLTGNVVPCCSTCNYMKRTMGAEEFLSHVRRICRHTEGTCQDNGQAEKAA